VGWVSVVISVVSILGALFGFLGGAPRKIAYAEMLSGVALLAIWYFVIVCGDMWIPKWAAVRFPEWLLGNHHVIVIIGIMVFIVGVFTYLGSFFNTFGKP